MADAGIRTLRELIWFRYARIIARNAIRPANGRSAQDAFDALVNKTLDELRSGAKDWSDVTQDDSLLAGADRLCAYCGGRADLAHDHIVPSSLAITEYCPDCETVQTIHNKVWSCKICGAAKGTLGLYQFYQRRLHGDKQFSDKIPALLEKKYLKVVYDCLDCAHCLESGDLDGDGKLTVLDIDHALQQRGHLWSVPL